MNVSAASAAPVSVASAWSCKRLSDSLLMSLLQLLLLLVLLLLLQLLCSWMSLWLGKGRDDDDAAGDDDRSSRYAGDDDCSSRYLGIPFLFFVSHVEDRTPDCTALSNCGIR